MHKILYKTLSLDNYLKVVSSIFFLYIRLGLGRYAPRMEYAYHLPKLVSKGDTVIDIGANLGYYSYPLSKLVTESGKVFSIEPMQQIINVLRRNLKGCHNVEILNYALGAENKCINIGNDSSQNTGFFGTGQNFVNETNKSVDVSSPAEMRRGSELFKDLKSLDFIKCDIEGYELIVMNEMRPIIEQFKPTVLIETYGENREQIIDLFTVLGYIGYTLERGSEIPISKENNKDIIFKVATKIEK